MTKVEYQTHAVDTELLTHQPTVTLIGRSTTSIPFDNLTSEEWAEINSAPIVAGQAARTCYSTRPQTPADFVFGSEKYRGVTESVIDSTRESGHHTTREHVSYTFTLTGVSRYFAWSVLHSHPHYSSDQQSQRYVEMKPDWLALPHLQDKEAEALMHQSARDLVAGYHDLTDLLIPTVREIYLTRFPGRRAEKYQDRVDRDAQKKAQEIARYLLPWGFQTSLYHTVNELTLLRYQRLSESYDIGLEARLVIQAMVESVRRVDPNFGRDLPDPLPLESTPEFFQLVSQQPEGYYELSDEFDQSLGGQMAHLEVPASDVLIRQLGNAVRLTLGISMRQLSDIDALDLMLNPKKNPLLSSTLGESTMHQLTQTLNQINLSAYVSLSHSADSQLQRHRGLNHTRPIYTPIPRLEQDIVIPALIQQSPAALKLYLELQQRNIDVMHHLAAVGVDPRHLNYLQTNATRIRKMVSGPLGAFHHFIKARTCLTAQEEIYDIARIFAQTLHQTSPDTIGRHFAKTAPCGIRQTAEVRPYCPEGDRYCGVTIWKRKVTEYPDRDI